MRKIAAHYIFPINSEPIKNGILHVDNAGVIVKIEHGGTVLKETASTEFYNGIIIPGFVNAHCHLELSHLKNKLKKHQGIPNFIEQISKAKRTFFPNEKDIIVADKLMQQSGTVLVGDISNTDATLSVKRKSAIDYHTFVEVYGLDADKADEIYANAEELKNLFRNASIVPHASYSLSKELLNKIKLNHPKGSLYTIHNQESSFEDEMFLTATGLLYDKLMHFIGRVPNFIPTNKSALASLIDYFPEDANLLCVHNTYTSKDDLMMLRNRFGSVSTVLCPKSNLYIENQLPDIQVFMDSGLNICIGTDSLATNNTLSILEELKVISAHFPHIPLDKLLEYGTINGAKALNKETKFGTLEVGKAPGINLLTNLDLRNLKLTRRTKVKVLF